RAVADLLEPPLRAPGLPADRRAAAPDLDERRDPERLSSERAPLRGRGARPVRSGAAPRSGGDAARGAGPPPPGDLLAESASVGPLALAGGAPPDARLGRGDAQVALRASVIRSCTSVTPPSTRTPPAITASPGTSPVKSQARSAVSGACRFPKT